MTAPEAPWAKHKTTDMTNKRPIMTAPRYRNHQPRKNNKMEIQLSICSGRRASINLLYFLYNFGALAFAALCKIDSLRSGDTRPMRLSASTAHSGTPVVDHPEGQGFASPRMSGY
jgi:hypothetical protein